MSKSVIKYTKKPKLVRNQMTKKFFEPMANTRNLQSEECYRKIRPGNEAIEQFTFYGKDKFRVKGSTRVEGVNEFQ